jgi:hypothetical protein
MMISLRASQKPEGEDDGDETDPSWKQVDETR